MDRSNNTNVVTIGPRDSLSGTLTVDGDVRIEGTVDRDHPVRPDVTLFNEVQLRFELQGVSQAQGTDLVDRFKKR